MAEPRTSDTSPCATSPRCGSAARPTSWSRHHRATTLVDAVRRATPTARRCCCWPAAATSSSPTRASAAPSCASRPAASRSGVRRVRRRDGDRAPRGRPGTHLVARAVDRGLGRRSRRSPASPAPSAPRPIQNVGAYGQEVSETIAPVRCWDRRDDRVTHVLRRRLRLRLPHQPLQGRPGRYVVLVVTFQFAARRPRRTRPLRRARAHPRRRGRRARPDAAGPRRGAGAAPRQGHGARRRPTTTPGAPARSSPTRWSRAGGRSRGCARPGRSRTAP